MTLDPQHLWWAVALGVLSAVSLPLGSAAGLLFRPLDRTAGLFAAFGAGALLAALSVELVAANVAKLHEWESVALGFGALLGGAIAGGVLFVALDRIVNARGGFLRKPSTTLAYFRRRRQQELRAMLRDLCGVSLLRRLPAEQVGLLVRDVHPESFRDGDVLFRQGDRSDRLFFVRSGGLELSRDGRSYRMLSAGGVVGELGLVTDSPRLMTACASSPVETLVLCRGALEHWRSLCPELDAGLRELAEEHLSEIGEASEREHEESRRWAEAAIAALREGMQIPPPAEVRRESSERGGAPLAVWLGMTLDGIPESLAIGSALLGLIAMRTAVGSEITFTAVVPYTLLAGLFLSNFPEAMSSSVGMRMQGFSTGRILLLWTSLLVLTAVGSAVGYWIGGALHPATLVAAEGAAAGAMLAMLASTMIPEAVHMAGRAGVALATLAGFLAAVSFAVIE